MSGLPYPLYNPCVGHVRSRLLGGRAPDIPVLHINARQTIDSNLLMVISSGLFLR